MTTTRADRSASCVEHPPLVGVGLAQDGVQGRDDRHPQVPQQAEDVAAGRAAVDPVLVLEADDVGVGEVQEVGRPEVAVEVLLVDLEPDLRRVVVPLGESLTGTTKHSDPGYWVATEVHMSWVKVAIPHFRGR